MKTLLAVLVVVLAILATIMFTRNLAGKSALPFLANPHTASLHVANQSISLEVANNQANQQKGLSDRDTLASNAGMLFTFTKPDYYAFWMKNMKFPLDFLFLNNKRVVTIYDHVPYPLSVTADLPEYKPEQPADMVIELPAGKVQALGIKKGDILNLSL